MIKQIAIIGSTGSIGQNSLKVIKNLKENFKVSTLAAKSNIDLLEEQAKEFNPKLIAVYDKEKALELKKRIPHIEVVGGIEGIEAAASFSSNDFVISAMSGTLGLIPTIAAIKAKKDVGLANKEALVSGGNLVMDLVSKNGVRLIPIDSEHSAIFQCLNGEDKVNVKRIILTASGGPFRLYPKEQLEKVTKEEALCHPTFSMGQKISVDSSTLMNKGLEVIEAHFLFGIPVDQIDVVIHPQSLIHSMCEFVDGSMMAQMGIPSMLVPIQYALTYPERKKGLLPPFDFLKHSKLEFFAPDLEKFPCLKLGLLAAKDEGSLSCYMNGANEILVERFLRGEICWGVIGVKLEKMMSSHKSLKMRSLEDVFAVDKEARGEALAF